MTGRAATYLRSSKDRSDMSIAAQRRELAELARSKGLLLVHEYRDAVESGRDENRPGFQQLLIDLKDPARPWDHLLMVDTSRLSRRRFLAHAFKHEARKRGVTIVYSKVPDLDPITGVIVESVLEAMDEVHSLLSREKGLAGMRENVLAGYRAGGRAPVGYRLRRVETGAVRDGRPVGKSVLEPDPESAPRVAAYLKARAAGASTTRAAAGLRLPRSTLNAVEWNALTYAGATVWNVHAERTRGGGYVGGHKRRPRSEWVVREGTHEALITRAEAEAVLDGLSNRALPTRNRGDRYLLSGLLRTPTGEAWFGDAGKSYRTKPATGKGRYVPQADLEEAVVGQIVATIEQPRYLSAIAAATRKSATAADPGRPLRAELAELERRIARMMELAAGMEEPAAALREVDKLERARAEAAAELVRAEREHAAASALAGVTEDQVAAMLAGIADDLRAADRGQVKELLRELVERIELDPETLECRIHYRIAVPDRNMVASPRGHGGIPALVLVRRLRPTRALLERRRAG